MIQSLQHSELSLLLLYTTTPQYVMVTIVTE